MSEETKIYIDGMFFRELTDKTPDFVKAKAYFNVDNMITFLNGYKANGEEWVNFDIKEAKNGKVYAEVDTWKPNPKDRPDFDGVEAKVNEEINPDDTPF